MGYIPPQQPMQPGQPAQPRVAPPMGNPASPPTPGYAPPGQPPMQPMPQGPVYPQPGMAPRPFGPGAPGAPRGIVRRNPYAGGGYWGLRVTRIWRGITDGPYRSLGIVASSAVGVAIAIAIIGASNGIQDKINSLVKPAQNLGQQSPIDVNTIQQVLTQTTNLLTILSVLFTAAIVGLVTWISTGQRRRSLSLQVQQGESKTNLIVELLGESLALCTAGGIAGVILGLIMCGIIGSLIPLLPMDPNAGSVLSIFPTTVILAFVVTGGIVAYYTSHTDTRASLS